MTKLANMHENHVFYCLTITHYDGENTPQLIIGLTGAFSHVPIIDIIYE